MIKLGDKAPNINIAATSDQEINLSSFKGQNVVVYFYPKDSTPGCTIESNDFQDNYSEFKNLNTEVIGVSRDSIESHDKFKSKFGFEFDLISDQNEELCQKFGVIKPKKMFGKEFKGIERSTFLFDKDGKLVKEWRKVKVGNHVAEVLEAVRNID